MVSIIFVGVNFRGLATNEIIVDFLFHPFSFFSFFFFFFFSFFFFLFFSLLLFCFIIFIITFLFALSGGLNFNTSSSLSIKINT